MRIRCYAVKDNAIAAGIPGSRLGVFDNDSVDCVSISVLGIHKDTDKVRTIGELGWETIPVYQESTLGKDVSNNACLIFLDMNLWMPCTDKEDESIILDIFQDGFGILYCPSASTLLSCQTSRSIITVTTGGLPIIGTLQDKSRIPTKINDVSCVKAEAPAIPKKAGLRALSEFLKNGGKLEALRAYLPEQSSLDQDTNQDTPVV